MKIFLLEKQQLDNIKKFKNDDNPQLGAGLMVFCKKTKKFLICKRGSKITYPNQWCILGGMCKKNENSQDGAVREFREESGYSGSIENIKLLRTDRKKDFKYETYFGTVSKEFKPTMLNKVTVDGQVEIQDYKWIGLDELDEVSGKIHFGLTKTLKYKDKIEKLIKRFCK